MLAPGISTDKQAKKCVFGVFLKLTRIALVCKNLVIDIVLESGARGRNHTFLKFYLNIDGYTVSKCGSGPKSGPKFQYGKFFTRS